MKMAPRICGGHNRLRGGLRCNELCAGWGYFLTQPGERCEFCGDERGYNATPSRSFVPVFTRGGLEPEDETSRRIHFARRQQHVFDEDGACVCGYRAGDKPKTMDPLERYCCPESEPVRVFDDRFL